MCVYLTQKQAVKTQAQMYLKKNTFLRQLQDTKNVIVKGSACNVEYMNILPHTVIF